MCLKFAYWRRIYAQDLHRRENYPEHGAGSWRRFAGDRTKRIFIPKDILDYFVNPWKWPSLAHGMILTLFDLV